MRRFCFLLLFSVFSVPSAFAASGEVVDMPPVIPDAAVSKTVDAEWVDVSNVLDTLKIKDTLADLRAVTTDADGVNFGFYFASAKKKTFAVYRNGRKVLNGKLDAVSQFQKPVIFRMTASGDLLHAVHGSDLYVNDVLVSSGKYYFGVATTSVDDDGGVLTFPEAGTIVQYDIRTGKRTILYKHPRKNVQFVRRNGSHVAYTVFEKGAVSMYRNGRVVGTKPVLNPVNFALSDSGEVFYFTSSARGYALYRNTRSYVTGKGAGAYVDIDQDGDVWHLSYVRSGENTDVRLQKNRDVTNLLPADVANVELSLSYPDGGYGVRGSFDADPLAFFLLKDGEQLGASFPFESPYNDTLGTAILDGAVVLRAYTENGWQILADGEPVTHSTWKKPWFFRVQNGELTVYATK